MIVVNYRQTIRLSLEIIVLLQKPILGLVTVGKNKDVGFFARLIVVTKDGDLSETLGMATTYNATPGIGDYERGKVSDERLKALYRKMQTNVTFWCGREIKIGTDSGDGL